MNKKEPPPPPRSIEVKGSDGSIDVRNGNGNGSGGRDIRTYVSLCMGERNGLYVMY
jgi:hypothetical protein